MKLMLILLSFLVGNVFAKDLSVKTYIQVQEALAGDDFKKAQELFPKICQGESCQKKFKRIDDLREEFKTLSEFYIKNVNKNELKGLIVATCPMAKARWIQKDGSIANPYYGKSMLECGEKI
jgi:hypothetical protein